MSTKKREEQYVLVVCSKHTYYGVIDYTPPSPFRGPPARHPDAIWSSVTYAPTTLRLLDAHVSIDGLSICEDRNGVQLDKGKLLPPSPVGAWKSMTKTGKR